MGGLKGLFTNIEYVTFLLVSTKETKEASMLTQSWTFYKKCFICWDTKKILHIQNCWTISLSRVIKRVFLRKNTVQGKKFHMGMTEWTNHMENCWEVFQNNPISMTTLGDKLIPFLEWPHTRSSTEMSIFHLGRVGRFSFSCWKLGPETSWASWRKKGYFSLSGLCITERYSWTCWSGWRNDCSRWILTCSEYVRCETNTLFVTIHGGGSIFIRKLTGETLCIQGTGTGVDLTQ